MQHQRWESIKENKKTSSRPRESDEEKKGREHALDQESDQEKKKKRKHALNQESDQEKKTFFFSYFLIFFYKFPPQDGGTRETIIVCPRDCR